MMDRMSTETEVVEFGGPAEEKPPRRRPAIEFLRGLATDRRVPVLVAGLGAVAVFASLVSEWQVTAVEPIDYEGDGEVRPVQLLPTDLFDLGGIGAAYLFGLFLLVMSATLVLFGPAAGRRYARLAGFGAGGMLIVLLLAMVQLLGSETRLISRYFIMELAAEQNAVSYGRGLWCALAGVSATLLALWLTSREPDSEEGPRWVRAATADEEEPGLEAPLDLTIEASAPFATFPGQRDQPHRS
jgi:hypothetical protein